MTARANPCSKCGGDGHYCWTCGEREHACECEIDTQHDPAADSKNIGTCDECKGSGEEP